MLQKKISEKQIYKGKTLTLFESEFQNSEKKVLKREVVKRNNAAAILAITQEDKIILVKQYRQAIEEPLLEIPAGIIEDDETGSQTACKELIEEAGFKAKKIEEVLHYYSSAGYTDEIVFIYRATDLEYVGAKPEDEEEFEIVEVSMSEAVELIKKGDIVDAKTIIAIMMQNNE